MERMLTSRVNRRRGIAVALALFGLAAAPSTETPAKGKRCPEGQTKCKVKKKTTCVSLPTDPANCGACGNVCAPGSTCCAGSCVSLPTDPANCGACGIACDAGSICVAGQCRGEAGQVCTSDAQCVPGRNLTCSTVTGCDLPGQRCCVIDGQGCSADCDCCGINTCQNGTCRTPEDRQICYWDSSHTVPCSNGGCCPADAPICFVVGSGYCCAKGYPVLCGTTHCCMAGMTCCGDGCCAATSASSPGELIAFPGQPALRSGSPSGG